MKKIFLLTISIILVSAVFAKAGNPIPSYNIPVTYRANFQEDNTGPGVINLSDEKRDMNVSNDGAGGTHRHSGHNPAIVVVYIYRLDHSKSFGPFYVRAGEVLTVPIDGNRWGVVTSTNIPTAVSVWTEGDQNR